MTDLEAILTLKAALLEACVDAAAGREPSDFMLSHSEVRAVWDLWLRAETTEKVVCTGGLNRRLFMLVQLGDFSIVPQEVVSLHRAGNPEHTVVRYRDRQRTDSPGEEQRNAHIIEIGIEDARAILRRAGCHV